MKAGKFFLIIIGASGLAAAVVGLSPARAEFPPTLPALVLDQGQIGTRLDFDFTSGGKYFDESGSAREAYPGFTFTDGKTTVGLSYGLTGNFMMGLSLPVTRRVYSGYYLTKEDLGQCYSGGTTTTYVAYLNVPYDLQKTGIGDVTLEADYRFVQLPRFLPELAARIAWKAATGSSAIDLDREEINTGDGQSDLLLGIKGKGKSGFLLYDFSLSYRFRFTGHYSVTQAYYDSETMEKKRYTETYHYRPGNEFSAGLGISAYYRRLTLGVSANYINIDDSKAWLGNEQAITMGKGYYIQLTPGASFAPSPLTTITLSLETPGAGKNYPVNSPSILMPFNLFYYRISLGIEHRI
ncbi:MAG: hypothetical protein PHE84_15660 [bacterium]|nr:hypothetical protein [bacterium]